MSDETTHGDILRAIGNLEGMLKAIHETAAHNRSDITEAFHRLSQAEQRIAQGVILAVVASLVMPVVVVMLAPRLEFGAEPPAAHSNRP